MDNAVKFIILNTFILIACLLLTATVNYVFGFGLNDGRVVVGSLLLFALWWVISIIRIIKKKKMSRGDLYATYRFKYLFS